MSKERLRRSYCRRSVERVRVADRETRAQMLSLTTDEPDEDNLVLEPGEPISEGQTAISLVSRTRSGDRAKRRKAVIHDILAPKNYPLTRQNKSIVARQFERILRFARTLRNKGQLNPAVAKVLEIDAKRASKASILERTN